MPFSYVPPKSCRKPKGVGELTFRRMIQWGDLYWFDFGKPASQQKSFALPHPRSSVANKEKRWLVLKKIELEVPDIIYELPEEEKIERREV